MAESDINEIINQAIQGNEFPFDRFFENTFRKISPKLISLTKCKEDAQEVYVISMHKFWERFVINQQELPHNSIGYIYMMCKNAWLHQKKNWTILEIDDASYQHLTSGEKSLDQSAEKEIDDNLLKHKSLSLALEQLSPKCRKLMETEFDNDLKLKDLQDDLGFTNYQALVQAKYNCKKRLIKKVHEFLIDLKSKSPLHK